MSLGRYVTLRPDDGKESAMTTLNSSVHIAVFGTDEMTLEGGHGCGLWASGYAATLTAAGATPRLLGDSARGRGWEELLEGVHGVVLVGTDQATMRQMADEERLCKWCKRQGLPILGVDHGLHTLNNCFGGTLYLDLARELPEALQHRHPPEKGVRHAINVEAGTRLAEIYGEGEIVVNTEHRRGINRVARGFRISARALDGVIEAIEAESDSWFAMGVQWHPASETASGLDIQIFRGLIDAAGRYQRRSARVPRGVAA
jgi:putative glutamine amidotransferase